MSLPPFLFPCQIDTRPLVESPSSEADTSAYQAAALLFEQRCFSEALDAFRALLSTFESEVGQDTSSPSDRAHCDDNSCEIVKGNACPLSPVQPNDTSVPSSGEHRVTSLRMRAKTTLALEAVQNRRHSRSTSSSQSAHASQPHEGRIEGVVLVDENENSNEERDVFNSTPSPRSADTPLIFHDEESTMFLHPVTQPVIHLHALQDHSHLTEDQRKSLSYYHVAIAASAFGLREQHLQRTLFSSSSTDTDQAVTTSSVSHVTSNGSPNIYLMPSTSPNASPSTSTRSGSGLHREMKLHLYAAIDLAPSDPLPYFNLGVLHCRYREYGLAIKSFGMAIKRKDDDAIFYSNLGLAYLESNELNRALGAFSKAVSREPSSVFIANLACGCIRKQKWKEAINYLKRAFDITDSKHPDAIASLHCQLSHCYEKSQAWLESVQHASLSLSRSTSPLPQALINRAHAWAGQTLYFLALADAKVALELIKIQTNSINKREYLHLSDQVLSALLRWQTLCHHVEEEPLEQFVDQASDTISISRHRAALTSLRNNQENEIAKLQAEVKALQVNSHAPSQEAKQMAIMCVICLAETRSQLFEPCKHLLCCRTCGALVSACPFCKATIKKRRGPIYM